MPSIMSVFSCKILINSEKLFHNTVAYKSIPYESSCCIKLFCKDRFNNYFTCVTIETPSSSLSVTMTLPVTKNDLRLAPKKYNMQFFCFFYQICLRDKSFWGNFYEILESLNLKIVINPYSKKKKESSCYLKVDIASS